MGQEVIGPVRRLLARDRALRDARRRGARSAGDSHVSVAMKHVREGLPGRAARAARRSRPRWRPWSSARPPRTSRPGTRRWTDFVRDLEEVLDVRERAVGRRDGRGDRDPEPAPGEHRGAALAPADDRAGGALRRDRGRGGSGGGAAGQRREPAERAGRAGRSAGDRAERVRRTRVRPAARRRQGTRRRRALALDGDPTTAWETERYDSPDLGNMKKGVGLYLDAGRPIVARGMRIVTPKEGWDVRVVRRARQRARDAVAAGRWSRSGDDGRDAQDHPASTPRASARATTCCGSRGSPKEHRAARARRSPR